jgi:hypothetical protein
MKDLTPTNAQLDSHSGSDQGSEQFSYDFVQYLKNNYSSVDQENAFLLACLHNFYQNIGNQKTLLEVGGGPAIYSLISARHKVEEITFAEPDEWCRSEIANWRASHADSHDWTSFFSYVRQLENRFEQITDMVGVLRSKITRIVSCDVGASEPLIDGSAPQTFDIVSAHFCDVTDSYGPESYKRQVKNICSFVRPGGYLIMSELNQSHYWSQDDSDIPIDYVDENILRNHLAEENMKIIVFEDSRHFQPPFPVDSKCNAESANGENYTSIINIAARKVT